MSLLRVLETGGIQSTSNTSTTPLNAGVTFTGTGEQNNFTDVMVSCKTDQAGTLYFDFSVDGTNWETFPSTGISVSAGIHEIHNAVKGPRYFRVRFTNTSASNQTYLRLYTYYGQFKQLNAPLNSTIQADADATLVRPLDFNLMTAEGLYQNRSVTIKDGFNDDIDTGSIPEDITNEGGIYAGFPTGSVEAGELVVSGADTGTVFYFYLASPTDTDYSFGSKAIAGAGSYALGHNVWRCNFMYFISSSATATNVGTITMRNTVTTANVFCVIPIGYGQTYCSAYTVPAGSSVYIDRITGSLRGSTSGSLDGAFYYRDSTSGGHRLRFPFELQYGSLYFDDMDYLVRIPAGVDIIPRITAASTNNLQAKISYRILKVVS